jgi:hypothetical protein
MEVENYLNDFQKEKQESTPANSRKRTFKKLKVKPGKA